MTEKVWVITEEHCVPKVLRFPAQIRKYAKDKGFCMTDEVQTDKDTIVFSSTDRFKNEQGFYALLVNVR